VGTALGVQIPALRAAVVHLAREKLSHDGAEAQDANQKRQTEECVFHGGKYRATIINPLSLAGIA